MYVYQFWKEKLHSLSQKRKEKRKRKIGMDKSWMRDDKLLHAATVRLLWLSSMRRMRLFIFYLQGRKWKSNVNQIIRVSTDLVGLCV